VLSLFSAENPAISPKRGKIGRRLGLLLMKNGKSHTRNFDWCQNQRPWMTLKSHYALCFKTYASFGAQHENLNEIDPYRQRRRRSPMTLVSAMFMRIFAGIQWRGGVTRQWGNRKRRFSGLSGATASAPYEMRLTLLNSII